MIRARRGASVAAPRRFESAIKQGADGMELDIQRSADGVLAVCHDETIDRTSGGSGAIAMLSLAQLRGFDLSAGRVPGRTAQLMCT